MKPVDKTFVTNERKHKKKTTNTIKIQRFDLIEILIQMVNVYNYLHIQQNICYIRKYVHMELGLVAKPKCDVN